ncbi:MAG: T9SS type A sorting domain-containing protein [Flavobacteriales bacterium]|nr:T9SS type A sorting domain-containing protein [Flavobacteriales bacterium]
MNVQRLRLTLCVMLLALLTPYVKGNIITVTNLADSGPGSLRDRITVSTPADTITFAVTGTITLATEISWNKNIAIKGPGAPNLIVSGNATVRVFRITGGTSLIAGISIKDGDLPGGTQSGAGIEVVGATLTLEQCTIEGCSSTATGGALSVAAVATLTMNNCIVKANSANNGGGGIDVDANGNANVNNCTFNNNTIIGAGNGGAIRNASSGILNLSNCTFTNNQATSGGGLSGDVGSTTNIVSCTFSGNGASGGGNEIHMIGAASPNEANVSFLNTIIHNPTGGNNYSAGSFVLPASNGFNLCSDITMNTILTGTGDLNLLAPLLDPLGAFGGPTPTMPIQFGSPAQDAGTAAGAPMLDQRGFPRFGVTDIGAFEIQCTAPQLTLTFTSPTCAGGSDGSALAALTSGPSPYTYSWSNSMTGPSISGLQSGSYTVTATDASGCDTIRTFTIAPALGPVVSINSSNDVSCFGGADGSAISTVTGGTAPYTYQWNTSPVQTTSSATGLITGNYTVQVTDAAGCASSDSIIIGEPSDITVSFVTQSPTCFGDCDGAIAVTASGGTPPYLYNGNTNSVFLGVCAGAHPAVLMDANGCVKTGVVLVSQPSKIIVNTTTTDATCGQSDGSATAIAINGIAPYTYQWSSGDTIAAIDSVSSGIYMVAVVDANGCNDLGIAMVADAGAPNIIVNSVTDNTCFGGTDGAIAITVLGGTSPYTYQWSNGASTQDQTGLAAGPYEVAVMGANGCGAIKSIPVFQPDELDLTITEIFPSCGNADGSAWVSVSGGTGPYSYSWSTGVTDSIVSGLIWGVYDVTVTDASGCTANGFAALGETGGTTVSIDSVKHADCGGLGAIYTTVFGGAPPLDFKWMDSTGAIVDSVEDLVNVPPGPYNLIITDTNGCMGAANATIQAVMSTPEPICLVTVDSLTGTNLVVWEKAQSVGAASFNIYKESTQQDVYYLVGNVPYSSVSEFVDTVSNPAIRSWRYKIASVDSCGNESGLSSDHKTIHLTINSGLGGTMNLIWDHYEGVAFSTYFISRFTPSTGWLVIDSLPANLTSLTDTPPTLVNLLYSVSITHPDGCTSTKTKNFNSAKSNTSSFGSDDTPVMAWTTNTTDATFGNCDGTATINPSGGTPPYTYTWSDPQFQSTATATALCPGNYIITLADAAGNVITDTVVVGSEIAPGFDEYGPNAGISIFPNPNLGKFSLHISKPLDILSIKVYDIVGQEVTFKTTSTLPQKVEIEVLSSPGLYYISVQTNEGLGVQKIIIE